ncbi:hypothetical protein TNCV_1301391 [Trichonephila clavipes]|nr:hypothetical protein TNCV_1301391 [Trichonephila clavipes]
METTTTEAEGYIKTVVEVLSRRMAFATKNRYNYGLNKLIDYLYLNCLPKIILMNYTPNCVKIDDEQSLMKSLIVSIEESVVSVS